MKHVITQNQAAQEFMGKDNVLGPKRPDQDKRIAELAELGVTILEDAKINVLALVMGTAKPQFTVNCDYYLFVVKLKLENWLMQLWVKGLAGTKRVYLDIEDELKSLGYTKQATAKEGDIVVYFSNDIDSLRLREPYTSMLRGETPKRCVTHFGLVDHVTPEHIMVESKHGMGNVYLHPIDVIQPFYGEFAEFYRKKEKGKNGKAKKAKKKKMKK